MKTTQQRIVLGLALVLVVAAAAGGWFWWQERNQPPLPPVQTVPKTPPAPKGKDAKGGKPTLEELRAKEAAELVVPSAGNVSRYSELQAQSKEKDLILKLADQDLKLDEIKAKRAQLNAPPSAPAPLLAMGKMPDLPLGNLSPAPVAPRPVRQSVAVVSVQGVNDRMSATIRTSKGTLATVQVGMPFGGGKITHISRQGVTLRSGSKNIVLPFE